MRHLYLLALLTKPKQHYSTHASAWHSTYHFAVTCSAEFNRQNNCNARCWFMISEHRPLAASTTHCPQIAAIGHMRSNTVQLQAVLTAAPPATLHTLQYMLHLLLKPSMAATEQQSQCSSLAVLQHMHCCPFPAEPVPPTPPRKYCSLPHQQVKRCSHTCCIAIGWRLTRCQRLNRDDHPPPPPSQQQQPLHNC